MTRHQAAPHPMTAAPDPRTQGESRWQRTQGESRWQRTQGESRWQRIKAPTLLAVAVLAVSALLHLRDPHESGSWGYCPWLLLTGTNCPGCGGLRAVNDLTRGDLGAAASSNLLFVGALPLLLFAWGRWFSEQWSGRGRRTNTRRALIYVGLGLVVTIVFWVVRNLEFAAWLAP